MNTEGKFKFHGGAFKDRKSNIKNIAHPGAI